MNQQSPLLAWPMTFKKKSPKKKKVFVLALALNTLLLAACGGDNGGSNPNQGGISSSSSSSSGAGQNAQTTIEIQGENGTTLSARLASADAAATPAKITVPSEREKSEAQQSISQALSIYPWPDFWQMKALMPHPELYCAQPTAAKFVDLSEKLGGFHHAQSIYIEPDATAPIIQTGWLQDNYFNDLTPVLEATKSSTEGITIQRPDIVGRHGDKAFYLSKVYGLITVDFSAVPKQTSCALPLPGNPKNFVISGDHLFVLVKDQKQLSTGVIQLDISGMNPTFVDGLVFENQDLMDARLFNDTLALYLKTYEPIVDTPDQAAPKTSAAAASDAIDSRIAGPIYVPRTLVNHEMKVIATKPELAVTHSEVFLPEGTENRIATTEKAANEATRQYKYFNPFVSASGEYLVLTEQVNESIFSHYQTLKRNRCTNSETLKTPYRYCQTKWKRIENPDYKPLPASGVLACLTDLWTCIKKEVPRVTRYINVPDGKECIDTFRYRYICHNYETVEYDVPHYNHYTYTQFHAFRFHDGQFIRLDDSLAKVEKDQIQSTNMPFRVSGRVAKHDHIHFSDEQLYVVTSNAREKRESLHTLSILGNSAVHIDTLTIGENALHTELATVFSEDKIYVSDASYIRGGSVNSESDMMTISLADPIAPRISTSVNIPTKLEQLLFTGDTLLGVGTSSVRTSNISRQLGTITGFTPAGEEVDSLILGAEYRYYYSKVNSDDQVLSLDPANKRLLIPYSVGAPLLGTEAPSSDNRLTMVQYDAGKVAEEATFSLPRQPDRSMSVNALMGFAFQQEFIHQFQQNGEWEQAVLFDGQIPASIYYARQYPTQVQKREFPSHFNFKLIDSDEAASGEELASLNINRARSNVCTQERVLFDNDRILVVQEPTGHYISYQDCPEDRSEAVKRFIGYRITEKGFSAIEDQTELAELYEQSTWQLRCITNLEEPNGDIIKDLDVINSDQIVCYKQTEYFQKLVEQLPTP